MLKRQNGGGNQYGYLPTIVHGFECCANGHFRFPKAHVATHQSVHGAFTFHVGFYRRCGRRLVGRVFVEKRSFQF